jgi:serine/threonine-protein kinase
VRVPSLIKAKESPTPTPATDAANSGSGPTQPGPVAPPVVRDRSPSTQQILGLVVGGVGVIGVGLGSYFGIRAISKNSDAESHCPKGALCDDNDGVELSNKARQDAAASNIAFVAGGVLVATGAVLFLTGGRSDADRVALVPLVGPGTAAASLSGRF